MLSFHSKRRGEDAPHPRREPRFPAPVQAKKIEEIFSDCDDFEIRQIRVGLQSRIAVQVCWLDGVVSGSDVSEDILRPLTACGRLAQIESSREAVRLIEQGAVYSYSVKTRTEMDDAISDLTAGHAALVFDGLRLAVTFEVRTSNVRQISEATIEKSVKGARDAFVETLRINTSLVRRRIHSPELKIRQTVVGRQSETGLAVVYLEGIADAARVQEILDRLDAIDIEAVIGIGDLEPYLVSHPRSPFPQMGHTERPDKFASALLDGRIGLLADGLPLGFILPGTLGLLMHAPEDNARHFAVGSALTLLRYLALLLSLTLPALYVAIAMYHPEMIPAKLLLSVIQAEQEVPFTTPIIILSMLVAFELLQEAGLRLPDPIGQTVSIIGALLVGEAAVNAKVASPIAIIVVALAGIAGYNIPNQELGATLRLLRFGLVLASILAGMFGLTAALALIVWHLCTLENDGVAYLSPFVDSETNPLFHTLLRKPQQDYKFRDPALVRQNRRRQR